MNINNKLIAFICSFVLILGFVPLVNVQADTKDFNIISDTNVRASDAKKWAKSKGATDTFAELADLYWKYSTVCGNVNPGIAYVQAAKETGYGKFGGVLDESYKNPCGLKTSSGGGDYDPNAHNKFNTWDEGVQAHLDHLALYAGAAGYPKEGTYDPRHFVTIKGKASTVNSLGGKWAPSNTYGQEVGKLYMDLMDYSKVNYESGNNVIEDTTNTDNSANNFYEDESLTPNPGTPENKPLALTVEDVLTVINKTDSNDSVNDDKPSITSSIGWKLEEGYWYYYKSDGNKAIDWIKPDYNWYYLREDGKMATGWLNYNGVWYYLDEGGVMSKGLKFIDNKYYFFDNLGIMMTGIQWYDGKVYYFDDSGSLSEQNGWIKINNKWYYSEDNGHLKTGWLKEDNTRYYLQADGSMVTGLKSIDTKTYLFDESGRVTTGWSQINENWYYFNQSGEMSFGWITDADKYYYLYDTGAMARGWINISGAWYHLENNGAMTTGWIDSNGDSYYLDKSTGRLMINTTIDGYRLGYDGKKKESAKPNTNPNVGNQNNSDSVIVVPENSNQSSDNNISKKTIVVDAGHDYGKDYGAEKAINGVTYSETVLNMEVAEKLRIELEKRGYNVIMTRKAGERPSFSSLTESLSYRASIANNSNAELYISIHHNSAESQAANGVETLYSTRAQDDLFGGNINSSRIAESKRLATLINNNIVSKLNLTNRGAKDQNLYVCRNTNIPAVLVECGFITSPEEAIRCADSKSQQKLAEAIAEVVSQNY